ncbi:MAG: TetR/AcrR family transcriptional regulator [Alphaproteobacteria bacterium]|nr:TetR/AcrR family transcriptional regulator [Alphaproteobacteria bacterium]
MRYEPRRRASSRRRILAAARSLLTREGPHAVTIHRVMATVGMTHGGFYAHFESREALLRAASDLAGRESEAALTVGNGSGRDFLRQFVARYLGRAHRDSPEKGCPLPASLSGSAAADRQATDPNQLVRRYIALLAGALGGDVHQAEERSRAALAMMIGSLQLARLEHDEGESDQILRAGRAAVLNLLDAPP